MKDDYFKDDYSMNLNLFKEKISDDVAKMIYNDPFYGLNNKDNYAKWDALTNTSEPMPRRLFLNELRFHFGLTYQQS